MLLLGFERIPKSCSEFARRAVIVRFTRGRLCDVCGVKFGELSQILLLLAVGRILQ